MRIQTKYQCIPPRFAAASLKLVQLRSQYGPLGRIPPRFAAASLKPSVDRPEQRPRRLYSAAIRGGLIEAVRAIAGIVKKAEYSAAIRGGLIEAHDLLPLSWLRLSYSAAIRGGLIEAGSDNGMVYQMEKVFRRDSRRPH